MKDLFKELEGKYIKIKTWDEMCNAENSELVCERYVSYEIDGISRKDIGFINEDGVTESFFICEMRHLCGRVIKVDRNMISDGWFRMAEDGLLRDRELVYYDELVNDYWYLDTNMFDVLEEADKFYVIEETTHQRVFEGTREESFKYYKTYVDIFKKQGERIAVLKEL